MNCIKCNEPIDTAKERLTTSVIEIPSSYHRKCFYLMLDKIHEENMAIIKQVMAEQVYK